MRLLDIEISYPDRINSDDALESARECMRGVYSEYRTKIFVKNGRVHVQVFDISEKDAAAALLMNDRPVTTEIDQFFAGAKQALGVRFAVKLYDNIPEEIPQ